MQSANTSYLVDGVSARNILCLLQEMLGLIFPLKFPLFLSEPRQDWSKVSMDQLYEALQSRPKLGVAKNVILFLGDGMGISNVMASRVYNAQRLGKKFRDAQMSFEKFPYLGLSMVCLSLSQG